MGELGRKIELENKFNKKSVSWGVTLSWEVNLLRNE